MLSDERQAMTTDQGRRVSAPAPSVEAIVAQELDALPDWLLDELQDVAVVVCDRGRRERAYGLYHGDGAAHDRSPDRIVLFADTLLRDFGRDAACLRAGVRTTLRHEIGHHLGLDEQGVRVLGL